MCGMPFALRICRMLSCSLAVTRNSNSFESPVIRLEKKLAWNGVLIATQIFLIFWGLSLIVGFLQRSAVPKRRWRSYQDRRDGYYGVYAFHRKYGQDELPLGEGASPHEDVEQGRIPCGLECPI